MRLCVSYVYWTLLLVSVVSSGLLFLIVASEAAQIPEKPRGLTQENNIPLEDVAEDTRDGTIELSNPKKPTAKTKKEQLNPEENDGVAPSHEISSLESNIEKNLEVLKESLTQQPNLSQGISSTGQAVVLTLVDTAAAELQSLAEPRLTADHRSSRTSLQNTSSPTLSIPATKTPTRSLDPDLLPPQTPDPIPTISPSIITPASPSSNNTTEIDVTEPEVSLTLDDTPQNDRESDEVLFVRAEPKVPEDTAPRPEDSQIEETTKDSTPKSDEPLPILPELDDEAARARLVVGSSDEAASVILDGLVTAGPTDHHHEDIPSFSEWAQKRLEEAEKKKTHPNASIQNPGGPSRAPNNMKVRSKNYASPDCGAKIVAVNPEARSARSVLVSTRDEYMLNTCTSRVWFVVELCEAIQAKKIELANFELFSSSPKEFSVHVTDRFPTRDWSPVGQFTAKDQRDIQSFALHPHLFGKFIKIELHSHYGSEHFCPISLFRAYGTSEFEVLETETDHQETENDDDDDDDEDEDEVEIEGGSDSRNLFGSARDAVLRIVKKAAEVLVKSADPRNKNNITKIQESIEDNIMQGTFPSCMTPRYAISCANCTDERFAGVFELLSCRAGHLDDILKNSFVNDTLNNGELCGFYGVDVIQSPDVNSTINDSSFKESLEPNYLWSQNLRATFLASIFSPEYVVALCNVVATRERKLVLNSSYEFAGNAMLNSSTRIDSSVTGKLDVVESNGHVRVGTSTCLVDVENGGCKNFAKETRIHGTNNQEQESVAYNPTETSVTSTENLATQIKPTKTLSREDARKDSSVPILEPSKDPNEESVQEVLTTPSPILNVPVGNTRHFEEDANNQINSAESATPSVVLAVVPPSLNSREGQDGFVGHESLQDNSVPAKVENGEGEAKGMRQQENSEEAKFTAQDQMSLDSIFSDFKDLEGDGTGGGGHYSNHVTQPTASSTPQQKESVFLRLSNRIKALERNMSLSGQYLEELSKRYKKQVEEMQRSLERATAAMSEESRKGEERELRRLEEISALRDEISTLTQSLEILLYDRNSWRSKLSTIVQHFALIVVEIVVLILVLSYCRRISVLDDVEASEISSIDSEEATRRRSAGAMSSVSTKKSRVRRPSEIASRIAGTYRHLMIDERSMVESKKDKKKRRKRELSQKTLTNGDTPNSGMPGGTALPSRRSSSTDQPSSHEKRLELRNTRRRPDSAPVYSVAWETKSVCKKSEFESPANNPQLEIPVANTRETKSEEKNPSAISRTGGILKAAKLSSPSFMKTALGSRSKRNVKAGKNEEVLPPLKSENWEWHSKNLPNKSESESPSSTGATNGHHRNPSDESGSSSATATPANKKDKKTSGGGLRKMSDDRRD